MDQQTHSFTETLASIEMRRHSLRSWEGWPPGTYQVTSELVCDSACLTGDVTSQKDCELNTQCRIQTLFDEANSASCLPIQIKVYNFSSIVVVLQSFLVADASNSASIPLSISASHI